MVLDSRGMIQHYRRIYNAKPSPEIARTRTSSSSRRRPATAGGSSRGLSRRSTSFQSLNESSWLADWSNNGWGNADWTGSVDAQPWPPNVQRVPTVQRQQDPSHRRPYSANVATAPKPKGLVSNFDASGSGRRGVMPPKSNRPSSAVVASQLKQDLRQRRARGRLRPSSTAEMFRANANGDERTRQEEAASAQNFFSYRDMKRFRSS